MRTYPICSARRSPTAAFPCKAPLSSKALLRQPGGFEGFGPRLNSFFTDDPPAEKREQPRHLTLHRRAARRAGASYSPNDDHLVASRINGLGRLNFKVPERRPPVLCPLANPVVPEIRPRLWRRGVVEPDNLRVAEFIEGGALRVIELANDFDVLHRHRLLR